MVRDPNSAAAEPEVGVTINAPSELDVCTWTSDVDEKRRAFVVNQMANCDVEGKILVQNMHEVCEWLKSGKMPDARVDGSRPAPSLRGIG